LVFSLWVHPAAEQTKEIPVADGNVKIQVSENAVLVPVVVRDSEGRGREFEERRLQVFDKDKLQIISRFLVQKRVRVKSARKARGSAQSAPSFAAPNVESNERERNFAFGRRSRYCSV
jgi:hypothetical protein